MAPKLRSHRRNAFVQQHGCCFYCALPVWERERLLFAANHRMPDRLARWLRCTAEHLTARCDGGKDRADNVVAACLWCNSQRHKGRQDRAPDSATYRSWVRQKVAAGKWHPVIQHRTCAARSPHRQSFPHNPR